MCITHISVSATPLSGCPYKALSFPKVRHEPFTQVLSRHLVWKNKNGLLDHQCPVSVYGGLTLEHHCLRCPLPYYHSLFLPLSSFATVASVVGKSRQPACVIWQSKRKSWIGLWCACLSETGDILILQFLSGIVILFSTIAKTSQVIKDMSHRAEF